MWLYWLAKGFIVLVFLTVLIYMSLPALLNLATDIVIALTDKGTIKDKGRKL